MRSIPVSEITHAITECQRVAKTHKVPECIALMDFGFRDIPFATIRVSENEEYRFSLLFSYRLRKAIYQVALVRPNKQTDTPTYVTASQYGQLASATSRWDELQNTHGSAEPVEVFDRYFWTSPKW